MKLLNSMITMVILLYRTNLAQYNNEIQYPAGSITVSNANKASEIIRVDSVLHAIGRLCLRASTVPGAFFSDLLRQSPKEQKYEPHIAGLPTRIAQRWSKWIKSIAFPLHHRHEGDVRMAVGLLRVDVQALLRSRMPRKKIEVATEGDILSASWLLASTRRLST